MQLPDRSLVGPTTDPGLWVFYMAAEFTSLAKTQTSYQLTEFPVTRI